MVVVVRWKCNCFGRLHGRRRVTCKHTLAALRVGVILQTVWHKSKMETHFYFEVRLKVKVMSAAVRPNFCFKRQHFFKLYWHSASSSVCKEVSIFSILNGWSQQSDSDQINYKKAVGEALFCDPLHLTTGSKIQQPLCGLFNIYTC